ncbi:pyridoxamine 5'-phosphate oxidase family protein [Marinilabiliaceae bacterium JC017]|nr:pyridoxamine 5'-phosphate oxidase family protein [Marinilabiliaceae bacterium JC017]
MKTETIKSIEDYLKGHGLLTLATVNEEGQPMAHSVEYVSDGIAVYFVSHPQLRKMQNIGKNPKVAYTVDEDYKDWSQIQGVQMLGRASFVKDETELKRIMGMYVQKFPQVTNYPPEFADKLQLVKLEPVQARFIDNTKGMGNTETIDF